METTMTEEKYTELFYLVTFTDESTFFLVPYHEIEEPEMAECFIPYVSGDNRYVITCYVTNAPNWRPVIAEMLILKTYFEMNGIPKTQTR
jgi:hypothetical protein